MATYYFDTNGATAGFGTLTGNWNPTTALWSTNSAGTSATASVTFTDADTAQFGFTGTTGTAGTATITTGVTNTVNQVVTANLAGLQTIAAAGTGALALAGTTPTINVGSAGGLTISAPITGTAGFTKAGSGTLNISGAGGSNSLSGGITVTQGFLRLGGTSGIGTATTEPLPNITSLTLNSPTSGDWVTNYLNNSSGIPVPYTISIDANNIFYCGAFSTAGTAVQTFANTISGAGIMNVYANGIGGYATGTTQIVWAASNSLSDNTSLYTSSAASNPRRATWSYTGAAGTISSNFRLDNGAAATTDFWWAITNGGTGKLTLSGNISKQSSGAGGAVAGILYFGTTISPGTWDLNDIEVSGIIRQVTDTGTLSIVKVGSRRLILSGTNTYTGANTVSAGTLVANNNSALGAASGTASSVATGATLEIASGITVNKASTQWTLNGNTAANGAVYVPSGNAGLNAANFVLGTATTDIKADAGATLTLTSAGAISGNFILRHVGTGTAVLAQTAASTFTALNIQSGTVSVSKELAAGGVSSGIGNGASVASNWLIGSTATAGTFRYTGAACSSNRNFTIGTAGSTFDASGSGVLTLTGTTPAFSAANTACTLTLAGMAGTSASPNTSAMVLPDNTQPVGLTKTGTGAWKFTALQTYTGATTITGGSMSFAENNISTNVVFNGPGTLREVVLNGVSKTITCSAGALDVAELIATSSHNTITGSSNITTGTLKLTTEATAASKPVKVLGDTDVNVTSKLQTSTGILQRGQMRYGGDLTFQAGSTFIIGG